MIAVHNYDCKENTKTFSRSKLLENLSYYLNKSQQDINIQYNENGKPQVSGLFFSISHCRDKVVQVFSSDAVIGVDIEYKNSKRSFIKMAQRYFHPLEFKCLNGLSSREALQLFYKLWTAKEAVCKAHGGRLWYYLADNYLTDDFKVTTKIKGMNLQFLKTIPDFNICMASSEKIENITYG